MGEVSIRVLILFAHPAIQKSRVNVHLARAVRDLERVTFHDLYETYPDFLIDVGREQELLAAHDFVILQHPFYWYSTPAIFKEWQDLVLTYGWAYGEGGTALRGKKMMNVLSAGGGEDVYQPEGANRFTIRQLLAPLDQTAHLCGMDYLAPFVTHGIFRLSDADILEYAADYRRLVEAARDGRIDWERAKSAPRINADLDAVILDGTRRAGGVR